MTWVGTASSALLAANVLGTRAEGLAIQVLGGFSAGVDGQRIDDGAWRLRKAKSLIKVLALATGHRLHREQLSDILWPELDATAAANNLHKTLHAARTTLQPAARRSFAYLQLQGDTVVLAPEGSLYVDGDAFRAAAAAAARKASPDPALYEAALALYTGDLLPEDLYQDWAIAQREELVALWCTLALELAALWEQQGEAMGAIALLQQVTARDATNETAQAALMRLLARTGQRHQALRQYKHLCEALRHELDVDPAPSVQALYQELRSGLLPSVVQSPSRAHVLEVPASTREPALVGASSS